MSRPEQTAEDVRLEGLIAAIDKRLAVLEDRSAAGYDAMINRLTPLETEVKRLGALDKLADEVAALKELFGRKQ